MPRESGPPGPAQESLLGSEEAAPELNAFEAFRAGRKLAMNPADHLGDYGQPKTVLKRENGFLAAATRPSNMQKLWPRPYQM